MEHCGFCDKNFQNYDELVEHDTNCHGYTHNNYFFWKGKQ